MTLIQAAAQQDFAAGMVRVAPHLLPPNAAWLLKNLNLDDDGSAYRRGGTTAMTGVVDAAGLTWCWDGRLAAGDRTVLASPNAMYVLNADDSTVVQIAATGLAAPVRAAVMGGVLYIGTLAYAGSRLSGAYSTGTVAVTNGSATVNGTGTAWLANLGNGSLLSIAGRLVVVASVDSDTQITLSANWTGASATGQAYTAGPTQAIPAAIRPSGVYANVANRLFSAVGDRVYFSGIGDANSQTATDYHRMPGAAILAVAARGRDAMVFTNRGTYVISNPALNLTDELGNAQQQLSPYSTDLTIWEPAAISAFSDGLVVPCIDGLWLLGDGPPVNASLAIRPLWESYVTNGYTLGAGTVYGGRYMLPVFSAGLVLADMLVCRLDRPVDAGRFGTLFPWTSWAGAGADMRAFAVRVGSTARNPLLLGAAKTGHLVRHAQFTPVSTRLDHDGSAISVELVTRDYATGPLNENLLKKVRVRYELTSATGTPVLNGFYGSDRRSPAASWGSGAWGTIAWTLGEAPTFTTLPDTAPASDGNTPFTWPVNRKVRFFRFRLTMTNATDKLTIRSVELFARPSGRTV